ncbi:MAG: hypothetical protein JSV52_12200 [Candidatus Zixiibacteriota bacterium]|nr:MAG: hypothetical protein JSV52_12200 [candidate division Zixibacteria bacterium]
MKAYNKCITLARWLTSITALLTIFSLAIPSGAGAVEVVSRPVWSNTIETQGSFAYGARGGFRELYGNGLTLALRYEHRLGEKTGLGVHVARVQQCDAGEYAVVKLKHRDLAVTPLLTYSLVRNRQVRLFGGGGMGLSFRKITLETLIYDIVTGDPLFEAEYDHSETSVHSLLMVGADFRLGRSLFFGARVTWDHHFFGDVEVGDFGDTGGFNFGGSLGFGF